MKRTIRVSHFDKRNDEVGVYEYNPNASVDEIVEETLRDMDSAGSAYAVFEKDGYEHVVEDGTAHSSYVVGDCEIDMYEVKTVGGEKVLDYRGYIWNGHDNDCADEPSERGWTYCIEYSYDCEVPVAELVGDEDFDSVSEAVAHHFSLAQQYGGGMSDYDARAESVRWMVDGYYLDMDDVTVDTPDGMYWC